MNLSLSKSSLLLLLSIATNVDNVVGYEVVGAYDISHLGQYGEYFAGGWIPSDTTNKDYLYLTTDAEESETSAIVEVKLLRNETTGQVIGIDTTVDPVTKLVKPYLDHISNLDPNGKLWYGTVYDYDPYLNCWASWDSASRTITEEGCNDLYGDQAGLWGMQFVDGNLYGTGPNALVQVTLNDENQPTNSSKLCDLSGYYIAGVGAIPSGVDQGSFMMTDWDNDKIFILDKETCTMKDFTTTLKLPWGFFWDPYTNDFFITTWEGTPSLFHISGFTTGVDLDTVFNNINAAAQSVTLLVQSAYARRGLRKPMPEQAKPKAADAASNGMAKSGLFDKKKIKENCQKDTVKTTYFYKMNCGSFEFDQSPEDITDAVVDALTDGDEAAVIDAVTEPLTEIFASDSFQTDVLDGGEGTKFEENLQTVIDGIAVAEEKVIENLPAGTPDSLVSDIEAGFAKIQSLLSLFVGVIEDTTPIV